jgi:periplasmic divalent cation tolerance protein
MKRASKPASQFAVVFVTAPDTKVARRLARTVLEQRLAACANLLQGVESHYWWQGKLDRANEVLIIFKTRKALLASLEAAVLKAHPYQTPEFVALELKGGNRAYLDWILESCQGKRS